VARLRPIDLYREAIAGRDIGADFGAPFIDADAGAVGIDAEAVPILDQDVAVTRLEPDARAVRVDAERNAIFFDDSGAGTKALVVVVVMPGMVLVAVISLSMATASLSASSPVFTWQPAAPRPAAANAVSGFRVWLEFRSAAMGLGAVGTLGLILRYR
jgi:hypothetical protein